MTRAISRKTYHNFAKRYGIKLMKKHNNIYKYKLLPEIQKEIYDFEYKNNIIEGLYFFKK